MNLGAFAEKAACAEKKRSAKIMECLRLDLLPWTAVSDADDDIGNNTCDSAYYNSAKQHIATMLFQSLISALLVFILPVSAQFQFFEQMFNQGGHQQQQQPQNAGSDSAWYQQRYEDGMPGLS